METRTPAHVSPLLVTPGIVLILAYTCSSAWTRTLIVPDDTVEPVRRLAVVDHDHRRVGRHRLSDEAVEPGQRLGPGREARVMDLPMAMVSG
jgi:hypothetical protein